MASVHFNEHRSKHVMITDLDQSDAEMQQATAPATATTTAATHHAPAKVEAHRKVYKKRRPAETTLHTISGNFSRRSRSAECQLEERRQPPAPKPDRINSNNGSKFNSYFNDLLQAKEQQMEKLLQRLATVHKFNEQFAEENTQLQQEVGVLDDRVRELRAQVASCGQCERLTEQLAASAAQNRTHTTDIAMMKTLVYRLNVQIEYYQDQLRLSPGSRHADDENLPQPTQQQLEQRTAIGTWQEGGLRAHTLTPLLSAYDEMIRDKEQLLQQYQKEFDHFTGELKRTLEENNRLLQQNEALKREVLSWRDERTRVKAQLEVCHSKVEAQTRKSDLAKEKLVEVMHCYEQKVQSLALDMEHLQAAYGRCKAELAAMKSYAAQPQDNIAASLQECKQLLEQLKQQHEREKQALERTIAELHERQHSNDTKMEKLRHENATLRRDGERSACERDELRMRTASLQRTTEKVKRSRDRLKARLRIALQWAQKLEEGQANIQNTWDALKRLETIVKHKESQVRGMHDRHLQEIDKMEKKLAQKEDTIRTILKGKLTRVPVIAIGAGPGGDAEPRQ